MSNVIFITGASIGYFTRLFKKQTGMKPLKLKKLSLNCSLNLQKGTSLMSKQIPLLEIQGAIGSSKNIVDYQKSNPN